MGRLGDAQTGAGTICEGAVHCAPPPVAAGSCSITLNIPGVRTLTAGYPGDVRFNASSDSRSQTVMASATTIFQDGFE